MAGMTRRSAVVSHPAQKGEPQNHSPAAALARQKQCKFEEWQAIIAPFDLRRLPDG
jgi:hypothetical protein